MSNTVTVVSASKNPADSFLRATYLGMSLSRFPQEHVPKLFVRAGNGASDTVPVGLAHIYNSAIDQAEDDDILLFVHDDVYIHDWFLPQRLTEALQHWDVVGLAGSANPDPRFPAWGLQFDADLRPGSFQPGIVQSGAVNHHDYAVPAPHVFGPTPMRCVLLDGLFLAARARSLRSTGVRFDEQFTFHLYDMDFCRAAGAAGLSLGTWPIAVTHQSPGAYDTESFREAARRYLAKWFPEE